MATRLVDELEIGRGERGTTATARLRLSYPARLLTADEVDHGTVRRPADERPELMLMLDQPEAADSRAAVHGALDASNAGRFAHELDRLTLGGTHELTVDLTAVTLLARVAVAVLLQANASDGDGGREDRRPLRLYAPAGSVADEVSRSSISPTPPRIPAAPDESCVDGQDRSCRFLIPYWAIFR
ncbi:hypothetical protein [Amycolatopsis sp. FDAARGOS 1241]|uniref:hypothetical protein n=1 Tax=Amycolatopsis sp. FDAARGOS 1241 TaxID=2778070 RepID=UPI00194E07EB|nr:hypothetical protein [Amycolatopsis sp. FDAARGOS 1241]QRP50040.1 hypothetical protein I6J71_21365 [Amycolatopsis sp. FDAARGOS 1241]